MATPEEIAPAFAAIRRARAQALYVVEDALEFRHRSVILRLASKAKLPTVHGAREFAEEGGLMSYGVDLGHLFRRSAWYVDKILKGANPSDLPIEQPTKFEFFVNLRTAKILGLAIPEAILLRADEVIQ